jgi:pyruvate formate lyase activating enzyme
MSTETGLIFDIQRFSVHDGPGIRTTVFFKGCPLRCLWCHNPESQAALPELLHWPGRCIGCGECAAACPQAAIPPGGGLPDPQRCTTCGACVEVCYADAREIAGREMTVSEVMALVERDVPFYDQSGGGMTASGGEPLWQHDFLLALLRACREREIHTALDTCGFAPWAVLDAVRHYVDLFLYDLKLMDEARHRRYTGASNEPVLHNLRALARLGHAVAVRVPLVPGVNDDEENLERTAALVAALGGVERVHLLPYHDTARGKYQRAGREYDLPMLEPPSAEGVVEIARIFGRHGLDVKVGG